MMMAHMLLWLIVMKVFVMIVWLSFVVIGLL